tara:strand:- start:2489 stop:2725 length:237 start_codon:yes stop_codon:yes gene_type:complete
MNIFNGIMQPLGKEHCMILYYLGVVNFFFGLVILSLALYSLFDKKTTDRAGILLLQSFVTFFMYYLYRIAYSICVKSL